MTTETATVERDQRKLELVTEGLQRYIKADLMEQVSPHNASVIADFILALKSEVNLSDSYRRNLIKMLCQYSKFVKNKKFLSITREDNLAFLDSCRRTEAADPLHKWIGTYNLRRMMLVRFFRWLWQPDLPSKQRKLPAPMVNIPMLKRKEQSIYKPTDLWTKEDDLLFLKYCPNKRDRAFHTVARDTSCRPSELLNLRIGDVVFKMAGNYQYAEVLVNGKTGSRHIPLINSIPYVKEWLGAHPQRGNPKAFLFPSNCHQNFLRRMTSIGLNHVYRQYRTGFLPSLLKDPSVPPEDKTKLQELLLKPFNPYIRRHSALTEKSLLLKEHTLRQHAGWSPKSNMHLKYLHYYGNESSESLLEAYGIVSAKGSSSKDVLRPKQCPNCNEPNAVDVKFCSKCKMVLSFDAFQETKDKEQEKDRKLEEVWQALYAQGLIKKEPTPVNKVIL